MLPSEIKGNKREKESHAEQNQQTTNNYLVLF
jgi:hypothetical protein